MSTFIRSRLLLFAYIKIFVSKFVSTSIFFISEDRRTLAIRIIADPGDLAESSSVDRVLRVFHTFSLVRWAGRIGN